VQNEAVRQRGRVPLIIPVVLITASSASILSTDLYVPSLPHLPAYFDTDAETVQLTMSINLLGFALAQLVHGPLSDRFGRRPLMIAGMAGFIVFSLACALAYSVESLILARLLQGIATSVESVVVLAVIRDLYDGPSSVRILGAYGAAVALAPAAGPLIGGFVHVWLGWRANFFILTALAAVVTALIWRFLPETTVPDRGALDARRLARGYAALLAPGPYLVYALISAAVLGMLFAYITAAPFVLIDRLGVPTERYGLYQAAFVLAFFLGSLVVNRAAARFDTDRLLGIGLALAAIGGAALPAVLAVGAETPAAITGAMSFYAFGLALVLATAPVRALDTAPSVRGSAAAMLGTLEMGGGAVGAFGVGVLHDGTAWPMALLVGGCGLLGAVLFAAARPWRARQPTGSR
jgi:DHA1 family bicyclomycin/chloramphenicol resistance-like MFS transporter